MISAATFHVITTELTIGMFALSGVAFLCVPWKRVQNLETPSPIGLYWVV